MATIHLKNLTPAQARVIKEMATFIVSLGEGMGWDSYFEEATFGKRAVKADSGFLAFIALELICAKNHETFMNKATKKAHVKASERITAALGVTS